MEPRSDLISHKVGPPTPDNRTRPTRCPWHRPARMVMPAGPALRATATRSPGDRSGRLPKITAATNATTMSTATPLTATTPSDGGPDSLTQRLGRPRVVGETGR